jgi:hypothetical protein
MRAMDRTIVTAAAAALVGICIGGNAYAQNYPGNPNIPGDPKPDINIVGDSNYIHCFFNDYRTVYLVGREDAWIASAELRTRIRWSNDTPIVKD